MDKYSIVITKPAELDIEEIVRYIATEILAPATADGLLQRFSETVITLEELPYRNGLVRDERLALQGIRKIMIDNYLVFYTINEKHKTVTIIRILNVRRNWLDIL